MAQQTSLPKFDLNRVKGLAHLSVDRFAPELGDTVDELRTEIEMITGGFIGRPLDNYSNAIDVLFSLSKGLREYSSTAGEHRDTVLKINKDFETHFHHIVLNSVHYMKEMRRGVLDLLVGMTNAEDRRIAGKVMKLIKLIHAENETTLITVGWMRAHCPELHDDLIDDIRNPETKTEEWDRISAFLPAGIRSRCEFENTAWDMPDSIMENWKEIVAIAEVLGQDTLLQVFLATYIPDACERQEVASKLQRHLGTSKKPIPGFETVALLPPFVLQNPDVRRILVMALRKTVYQKLQDELTEQNKAATPENLEWALDNVKKYSETVLDKTKVLHRELFTDVCEMFEGYFKILKPSRIATQPSLRQLIGMAEMSEHKRKIFSWWMGLGKTFGAFLPYEQLEKPAGSKHLILAPKTDLLYEHKAQVGRHYKKPDPAEEDPLLEAKRYKKPVPKVGIISSGMTDAEIKKVLRCEVIMCSYDMLTTKTTKTGRKQRVLDHLLQQPFAQVTLDEVHNLCKFNGEWHKHVKTLLYGDGNGRTGLHSQRREEAKARLLERGVLPVEPGHGDFESKEEQYENMLQQELQFNLLGLSGDLMPNGPEGLAGILSLFYPEEYKDAKTVKKFYKGLDSKFASVRTHYEKLVLCMDRFEQWQHKIKRVLFEPCDEVLDMLESIRERDDWSAMKKLKTMLMVTHNPALYEPSFTQPSASAKECADMAVRALQNEDSFMIGESHARKGMLEAHPDASTNTTYADTVLKLVQQQLPDTQLGIIHGDTNDDEDELTLSRAKHMDHWITAGIYPLLRAHIGKEDRAKGGNTREVTHEQFKNTLNNKYLNTFDFPDGRPSIQLDNSDVLHLKLCAQKHHRNFSAFLENLKKHEGLYQNLHALDQRFTAHNPHKKMLVMAMQGMLNEGYNFDKIDHCGTTSPGFRKADDAQWFKRFFRGGTNATGLWLHAEGTCFDGIEELAMEKYRAALEIAYGEIDSTRPLLSVEEMLDKGPYMRGGRFEFGSPLMRHLLSDRQKLGRIYAFSHGLGEEDMLRLTDQRGALFAELYNQNWEATLSANNGRMTAGIIHDLMGDKAYKIAAIADGPLVTERTLKVLNRKAHVHSSDISRSMLDEGTGSVRAERGDESFEPHAEVRKMTELKDKEGNGYQDGEYDALQCNLAFHCLKKPARHHKVHQSEHARALKEFHRALKKPSSPHAQDGGLLVLTLPEMVCSKEEFKAFQDQMTPFGFTIMDDYTGLAKSIDHEEEKEFRSRILVARRTHEIDESAVDVSAFRMTRQSTVSKGGTKKKKKETQAEKQEKMMHHREFMIENEAGDYEVVEFAGKTGTFESSQEWARIRNAKIKFARETLQALYDAFDGDLNSSAVAVRLANAGLGDVKPKRDVINKDPQGTWIFTIDSKLAVSSFPVFPDAEVQDKMEDTSEDNKATDSVKKKKGDTGRVIKE